MRKMGRRLISEVARRSGLELVPKGTGQVAPSTPVPDTETIRRYVGSSALGREHLDRVPELERPFVATKVIALFVAEKAH